MSLKSSGKQRALHVCSSDVWGSKLLLSPAPFPGVPGPGIPPSCWCYNDCCWTLLLVGLKNEHQYLLITYTVPAGRLQIEVFSQLSRKWVVGLEPRQAYWSLDPESAVQGARSPFLNSARLLWAAAHMDCPAAPSLLTQSRPPGRGWEGATPVGLYQLKFVLTEVQSFTGPYLLRPKSMCPESEYIMSSSEVKDSMFMPHRSRVKIASQGCS